MPITKPVQFDILIIVVFNLYIEKLKFHIMMPPFYSLIRGKKTKNMILEKKKFSIIIIQLQLFKILHRIYYF